jgi:predicted amino acid racemase
VKVEKDLFERKEKGTSRKNDEISKKKIWQSFEEKKKLIGLAIRKKIQIYLNKAMPRNKMIVLVVKLAGVNIRNELKIKEISTMKARIFREETSLMTSSKMKMK